jgi:hypothetical protein
MKLSHQNALKKQSAMTIPKPERPVKTRATDATSVQASAVTGPSAASAETVPTATTQRLMPKMWVSRAWSQTQQNSAQKLALKERPVVRVDASVAKVDANAVSAAALSMLAPMATPKIRRILDPLKLS